ncbi:MAG: universal stress protein UspA and related nucleotide-binding protein [Chromatiaceae bacterium]|nr:universal stress protein UspA and related nucleotide-binding protein [Chromatiaceae bacterium]
MVNLVLTRVVIDTGSRVGIPGSRTGNPAEDILNKLACSVLAVRPACIVTPVTFG